MIASLRGTVIALSAGGAVIECGGVGYAVQASPAALAGLRRGAEGLVLTVMVVREDAALLYGFADDAEREVFLAVQKVSGVGPKVALALLSVMSPDAVAAAIASGDEAAIQRVPGIGKKTAQRLILELAGTLAPGARPVNLGPSGDSQRDSVVEALTGLGWQGAAASSAVEAVMTGPNPPSEVGAILRAALRQLGGGRG